MRGKTIWLTGLSGAGKSTLAAELAMLLRERGENIVVLDGDDLRSGLNADLGFSAQDRAENVRRVGEVALFLALRGFTSIAPLISPYVTDRYAVRTRHEAHDVQFSEVYVATPLMECERRDVKGLYTKARCGEIPVFTGVSDPYEKPPFPDVVITTEDTPRECALSILRAIE